MDWDKIEKMRDMAEKAEKFRKHTEALEKFHENQQRLAEVEKQININSNYEKRLENLKHGLFPSEIKPADFISGKILSGRNITSLEMERINLVNEQMRLQSNPDLHRFTARERFEYQTAKYERLADRLQSSAWMPKEMLTTIDYGRSFADYSNKTLALTERNINAPGLVNENLKTLGIDDNFKKIGLANDYLNTLGISDEKARMLERAGISAFDRGLGEPIFSLRDDLIKSRAFINDYQKAFFNHSEALEKRFNHFGVAERRLDVAGRRWEQHIKSLSETDDFFYRKNTIEAAAMWQLGTELITDSLNRAQLDRDALFATRMLEFTDDYGQFARRTINRLKTAPEANKKAFEKSLEMAEAEVSVVSNAVSEMIDASGDNLSGADQALLQTPLTSNIFRIQRYELKLKSREVKEAQELGLLEFSVVNDLCFKSANCLTLIADCNKAAKFIGREEIFTPTTNTMYAGGKLATIVADNREMFGIVVNFLHIMLYEAAGNSNLRFDEQKGGYLPIKPDCDIIFAIKFLRNKFYFHEQKGSARQQEKDWSDIRNSFTRLGLPHYPTKPEEFREMHLTVIIEVEKFLEKLLRAINAKADEQFVAESNES
jgi:hypothetical protein